MHDKTPRLLMNATYGGLAMFVSTKYGQLIIEDYRRNWAR